jgi:hypothetical protein
MTSVLIPEEAASHLGAILLAFNREIFGSFLDEADELAGLDLATSAVIIAGTVLEYFERSPSAGALPPEHRNEIVAWRRLRNQAVHGAAGTLSVQQAREVIDGIRHILGVHLEAGVAADRPWPERAVSPHDIKGEYAYVPTSSDEFMKRKREDLELEDRG